MESKPLFVDKPSIIPLTKRYIDMQPIVKRMQPEESLEDSEE